MSNIYFWEKLTFSKFVEKVNFSEIKFEKIAPAFRSKKWLGIFGEIFLLALLSSAVYKTVSQISFNLFCPGDKRLLSEFQRK